MLPSILKGGKQPRATRRLIAGLTRHCHNFGRQTPAENTYDAEAYAEYIAANKAHWRKIYTDKDEARAARRLDRQRFRGLDMFTHERTRQTFPYCFNEETFRITSANVTKTRTYTRRREFIWSLLKITASPRRSRMAPPRR